MMAFVFVGVGLCPSSPEGGTSSTPALFSSQSESQSQFQPQPQPQTVAPSVVVEVRSVVGPELTEGEATAWTNARKLAVDSRGRVHLAFQYEYHGPSSIHYATSSDGRAWSIEEWPGRFPTVAVDPQDRVYIAYVERTPKADVLWLRRRPSGESDWETLSVVEAPPRSVFYPALAAGPGALHLAWESHADLNEGGQALYYARLAWEAPFVTDALYRETVVREAAYFATLAVDGGGGGRGRVYLAWEAARGAATHRIDAAVRAGAASGWRLYADLAPDVWDAREPSLNRSSEGVQLAFVARGPGLRSALYVARFLDLDLEDGSRWALETLARRDSMGKGNTSYDQPILAFPSGAGELLVWGNTVPAACGVGPLYWSYREGSGKWASPQPLIGDFASYPQLVERPSGVWHLAWTDRDTQTEKLRAFVVRYLRFRLN